MAGARIGGYVMRSANAVRAALTTFIITLAPAWQAGAQESEPPPKLAPPPEPDPTPTSFYVLAGGGASLPSDTDVSGDGVATSVDAKWGYGALAAFGVDFGDNVRTELEFAYRRAGIDSVGSGSTGSGARTRITDGAPPTADEPDPEALKTP